MEKCFINGGARWYEVEHLLGTVPDNLIAHMLGKPRPYVARRRIERFILPFREGGIDEIALSLTIEKRLEYYIDKLSMVKAKFYTMRDIEIFREHRIPIAVIEEARRRWNIAPPPSAKRWEEARRYIGRMPDGVVAEIAGVSQEMIRKYRAAHGIPDFKGMQLEGVRGKLATLLALEAASASFAQQIERHALEALLKVWDGRQSCCAWHIARPQKALPEASTVNTQESAGASQEAPRKHSKIAIAALISAHPMWDVQTLFPCAF